MFFNNDNSCVIFLVVFVNIWLDWKKNVFNCGNILFNWYGVYWYILFNSILWVSVCVIFVYFIVFDDFLFNDYGKIV